MTAKEAILLNLNETRRRAMMVIEAIPEEHALWKPDPESMTLIHTVRHFFECDDWFRQIILHNIKAEDFTPDWDSMPFSTIKYEIEYGLPYRDKFIRQVESYSDDDLSNIQIVRPKWTKSLGEFLMRCAYHDTYHTGQLQYFLRMLGVPRANVWL